MNRWTWSALGILVLGLIVAFLAVPFDNGGCPTGTADCQAYGSVPRIATIIVTAILALVLATIGSAGSFGRRP